MREPPSTLRVASDRKAAPPEHLGGPGWKLPHLLILVAACIGATVATYKAHHWSVANSMRGKCHHYGTASLSALIDVPLNPVDEYWDVLGRCARSQDFQWYCRRILKRSQKYRSSEQAPYEVLIAEYGLTYGWPLVSRHLYTVVMFEEKSLNGVYSGDDFYADYEGEDPPPILYPGLVGNWLFYFASSLLLLEIVYRIAMTLWSRITAPPPGHCRTCGYNLTANVIGMCPECGQPVPQAESKLKAR